MSLYFEKQKGRNCTIHAFNNAVQYRAITTDDMKLASEEILEDKRKQLEKRRLKRNFNVEERLKEYQKLLYGDNGYWSLDVLYIAALDKGFKLNHIPIDSKLSDNKSYIILGTKKGYNNKEYRHAVAWVEGKYLDSELSIRRSKIPGNFTPLDIYEINYYIDLESLHI